jgi:hypothetical protein
MKVVLIGLLLTLSTSLWFTSRLENEVPSIVIRKTSDGNLVALIKNNPSYPNKIFALQTTTDLSSFQRLELVNGRIQESEKCVEFRSSNGQQKIVFNLLSNSCSIATSDALIINGYGLVSQEDQDKYNMVLNFSGPVLPPIGEIIVCKCLTAAEMPSDGCLAGGVGSIECSYEISGGGTVGPVGGNLGRKCSTKCVGNGYYACCYDK